MDKIQLLPCNHCGKDTQHKRVLDGSAQVYQCVVCGNGWLCNFDSGVADSKSKEEIDELKAACKVFSGMLAYYGDTRTLRKRLEELGP